MLSDVEVFAIRAAGLPAQLREKLYPELGTSCERCSGTGTVNYLPGGMLFSCPLCTQKIREPR
ncbi:hypothetical protein G3O00_01495 [Burkholderia sp. Ac-20384]|uniref:hypothetical protein n=1 Tax=Burkholderia sp. Ac-20384 TaxID=2703902 RepID=UPI00197F12C6|nr:hypothetical protein [Burkholderia sp. Ac-20384]MBN3822292.1 hypothetical protein [Burkholderia sp. Ac-20384]